MGDFEEYLQREEKSRNTVLKYLRDVYAFAAFTDGVKVTKQATIAYKEYLLDAGYAIRSVNSMLASINCLFTFLCWEDCKVKTVKLQRQLFCSEEKQLTRAEYLRLCRTAKAQHRERLTLILQTICGTGIRVSELPYITVDAVQTGKAVVSLKGKTRTIFIVRKLQQKLLRYISEQKIQSGSVFITRSGKPLSRTNIWREMKTLCAEAEVDPKRFSRTTCATCLRAPFIIWKKTLLNLPTFSAIPAWILLVFTQSLPVQNIVAAWKTYG